ncbi:hypothetical protein B0H16DRAFT_1357548, partial [Mycena metata]
MSLPTNVKLSVQGHSRPGDTSHSMPKQAMIVRMTEETLDALQASPHMEFTFGPEPGISIGGTFFAMRPSKENSPHDLYLRASSASKPMAPLKLYANITGKFTVLQTLDKIQDKMRTTTRDADRIRKGSRVIMVDEPPADLSSAQPGKKRKAPAANSTMFRKAIPQPRPSTSARAPSPLPPATPSPLRTAVVKALAVKERSLDELLQLSPGGNIDVEKRRRKLVELLNQIAEPGKPPSLWRLKPSSWVEVRPYEWSDLSEQERTSVARTGRLTFSNLNIPESDPVWAHVLYRKGPEPAMVASSSGSKASPANRAPAKSEAPKRGLTSKEAKDRKMKPKPEQKPEISSRDEPKPTPRPSITSASKGKEIDDETSSSNRATTARKGPPSSGFRISKVPSPDTQPLPTAPPVPSSSNQGSRGRPVDVRMKDREPPRASLPARPAPPIAPPVQEKKAPAPRIKKTKDAGADREKERVDVTIKEPLKRKKPSQDVDDSDALSGSVAKRRKTDGVVPASTPRDLSLPKKPETLPVTSRSLPSKAIKRESSPQPSAPRLPQKSKSEPSSLPPPPRPSDTQRSNASSSKRRERRSPIYTSSEDEGEIRPPPRREPVPLPTPPATSSLPSSRSRGQPSSGVSRPLPTDREGLRVRYNATYRKYLASYSQLFAQQSKLESLLSNRDRDGSTVSDSDGDVEILSPEDTIKLKAEYKRWEKELESIRSMSAS